MYSSFYFDRKWKHIMQRKIPYCKLSCDISANNVGGLYGFHSPSYSPPYLMNIDVSSSIGKMAEARS
jgi:hypothetical protein